MRATKSAKLEQSKKAQGMPLNVIIIAVVCLIVLVVLVVVFSGKFGKFGTGVDDTASSFKNMCEIPGTSRECVASTGQCTPQIGNEIRGTFTDCEKKGSGSICCEK